MPDVTATITSKGQITIPKPIRDRLGLGQGDRVTFHVEAVDRVTMSPSAPVPLGRVPGLLSHLALDQPVTVEEMDEAIAQGRAGALRERK